MKVVSLFGALALASIVHSAPLINAAGEPCDENGTPLYSTSSSPVASLSTGSTGSTNTTGSAAVTSFGTSTMPAALTRPTASFPNAGNSTAGAPDNGNGAPLNGTSSGTGSNLSTGLSTILSTRTGQSTLISQSTITDAQQTAAIPTPFPGNASSSVPCDENGVPLTVTSVSVGNGTSTQPAASVRPTGTGSVGVPTTGNSTAVPYPVGNSTNAVPSGVAAPSGGFGTSTAPAAGTRPTFLIPVPIPGQANTTVSTAVPSGTSNAATASTPCPEESATLASRMHARQLGSTNPIATGSISTSGSAGMSSGGLGGSVGSSSGGLGGAVGLSLPSALAALHSALPSVLSSLEQGGESALAELHALATALPLPLPLPSLEISLNKGSAKDVQSAQAQGQGGPIDA